MIRQKKMTGKVEYSYFDYGLVAVLIFLLCFGLIMLYSTSYYSAQIDYDGDGTYYFRRQLMISALGLVVMYVVTKIDYHLYARYAKALYVISFILMALVQTPLGIEANGARRWIQLPFRQQLQPSEVTKIAVILFIPYIICSLGKEAYTKKRGVQDFSVWRTCRSRCIRPDGESEYCGYRIWNCSSHLFFNVSKDEENCDCFFCNCNRGADCRPDPWKTSGVQRQFPASENPFLGRS